jgi:hypothetical protein
MDDHDWLATRFEEHRNHLRAVAYRLNVVTRQVAGQEW